MTNVPLPTFGDTGFTSPEELAVLAGVLSDFNDAFGGALNTDVSTPQGQLATSFAAVISAFNDFFVDYTNQVDPSYASGRMQDAIARIYFLNRLGATSTVVTATVSGATGVLLPVGSLARATDGTIYSSLSSVTIPASGSIDVQFSALTTGPIACPAGSLDAIYRTVPGWDSVTNATDGAIGRDEESRAAFEARRALSVATNAVGIIPAVRGAVLGVEGIVDAYVTENETAANIVNGAITLLAHSLYVCVEGGTDQDVAEAIWSKKSPGCNYTGATSVIVEDDNSGYLTPPTYTVKFQRAAALAINFAVTIIDGVDVPSDAETQIETAITNQFPALAGIGQTMYATAFICAIGALGPWVRVTAITVNGAASQVVGIDEFPAIGTITVTIS